MIGYLLNWIIDIKNVIAIGVFLNDLISRKSGDGIFHKSQILALFVPAGSDGTWIPSGTSGSWMLWTFLLQDFSLEA